MLLNYQPNNKWYIGLFRPQDIPQSPIKHEQVVYPRGKIMLILLLRHIYRTNLSQRNTASSLD